MLEIDNILISLQFFVRHEKTNCNEINGLTFKYDRLLEAIAAAGLGYLILGEPLSWVQALGGGATASRAAPKQIYKRPAWSQQNFSLVKV